MSGKVHISQAQLVGAILKHLDKQGVRDMNSRQMNGVIAAANAVIAEFDKEHVAAKPLMGLRAWLASDDTGLSSKYMAHVLAPPAGLGATPRDWDKFDANPHPHDPDDFGRCVRLLDAVPELRTHLPNLTGAEHGPVWNAIAAEWDALEAWYREDLASGKSDRLYERLKALGGT